jgi:NAD(P)-dependent dehydrogenase (short-subunit alcohol dehydrogenase family)
MALFRRPMKSARRAGRKMSSSVREQAEGLMESLRGLRPGARSTPRQAWLAARRSLRRGGRNVAREAAERTQVAAERARDVGGRLLASPTVRVLAVAGAAYGVYKLVQVMREENLRGQAVLITGGSRGLGFLLAREFAREGCRVAICARHEAELADACKELRQQGADVCGFRCDVAERRQVLNLIAEVTSRFGQIDILVNNAGVMHVMPLAAATEADFERALDVMFWGTLYPSLAVARHMRPRRAGRIVNITSIGGFVSVPHMLPYSCAKFATVGLSQGLHAELARDGISVTTIVPGLMRVGSHLNAWFRGDQKQEFAWFSTAACLPALSMSAERAARQIVSATKRREALRILGLPANVLERMHGLFPGLTDRVMALVNRGMPAMSRSGGMTDARGVDLEPELRSRLRDLLIRPGREAAQHTHQLR